jgi:MOSC domain-containing protein YiiM
MSKRGPDGAVEAVHASPTHSMTKTDRLTVRLVRGLGVEGDAHLGAAVQHRSRLRRDATQPNLRQVHLLPAELHVELRDRGFQIGAGQMGENVTTRGIDLLGLPRAARLHLGQNAVVEVTGLRNPCQQLNGIQAGLMAAVLDRDQAGNLVRKAGIMAVVVSDGRVSSGDPIRVELPPLPHHPLAPV